MNSFPDDRSIAFLRDRRVDYIVVRAGLYDQNEAAALLERMKQRKELTLEMMWTDGPDGTEALFRVVPHGF